jgi:hypothetical protein
VELTLRGNDAHRAVRTTDSTLRKTKKLRPALALAGLVVLLAAPGASALPGAYFGPSMIRAEVLVQDSVGLRDYRIDRGRIQRVAPRRSEIRVWERDGTVLTIPVAPGARVEVRGQPATLSTLRRGMRVTIVRNGDSPAELVRQGWGLPPALRSAFFGAGMVRAEVVLLDGLGLHDYRIDRGRVQAVAPRAGTVRLLERDGTLVVIRVAPSARVTLNGQRATLSGIRRGMNATLVRDGDRPAELVEATR